MAKHYIYDVDEDIVLEKISQLQPLNYNQFRWWRRFDSPNKPYTKILIYSEKLEMVIMNFHIIIGKLDMLKWK